MGSFAKRLLAGGVVAVLGCATALIGSPPAGALPADGLGTMVVSPTTVASNATSVTLTFTYTAASTGVTDGALSIAVPGDWTPPTTAAGAGHTTSSCATLGTSGQTISLTSLTVAGNGTCTITYTLANAPTGPKVSTFTTMEESTSSGSLTNIASQPTVGVAVDGAGTMVVAPNTVAPSATGVTLTFTYTADPPGMVNGAIFINVPPAFGSPSGTATAAGYTTTNCPGTLSLITGNAIEVSALTLAGGASCTITYGDKSGTGPGLTAPSGTGPYTFSAQQQSTASGARTALTNGSPVVTVGTLSDGTGTLTVSPTSVSVGSTGNTLTFTYTASANGVSGGEIDVVVPAGWSTPTTTPGGTGYTTSNCGTVAVVGSTIKVTAVTLGSGASCSIIYGSKASASTGSSAPSTSQLSTFAASEKTTSGGTLTALATSPTVSVGTATPLPIRIAGTDAIGTSIAISQAEFPTPGSAGAVVLARDDFFSDALAGGPLAASVNGPMLITAGAPISGSLDPRVQAEIQRVLPAGGTVYILGGTLALSPNIDTALTTLGYHVVRLAGTDEFQTAVLIAQQMGNPGTIFEATGLNFFDALSAVPAAIQNHAAILLTNGSSQSFATGLYILAHPSDARVAIGGPLAAAGADPGATAVYGQDLFSTSAAVASVFFPHAAVFGAATSASFPDALGGGVYMATGGRSGPLLLVNPNTPLPAEIVPYLNSLVTGIQGYVFGGPLAIADAVLTALQGAVG